MNMKNADDKSFQFMTTVTINYEIIGSQQERSSSIKPFINKYHCDGIKYSSEIESWKNFERNSLKIVLHALYKWHRYSINNNDFL